MRRSSSAARALASVTHSPTRRSRSSLRVSPAICSRRRTMSCSTPRRESSCWRRVASNCLRPCSRSLTVAARELVLAALQFALGLVRLVLRHAAGVEELLLGFGRGGTDGGGRFGLAGGGDGGDFGGEGHLAQAGVEELPPAHHGKGAAAENQRGDYIKEEHVTSLQAPAGFGKARPRRQPSSPIWPPPLRTSRRPSSISPAFPSGRATSISTTARSITAGLTARASTSTFVAAQLSLRCSPLAAQSRIPARVRFFDATPRIPSRSCSNVKFRKEKKRFLPSAHPKGGRRPRPWAARSRRTPGFPTISPAFRGSSRSSARKSCGSPVAGSGARTVTP